MLMVSFYKVDCDDYSHHEITGYDYCRDMLAVEPEKGECKGMYICARMSSHVAVSTGDWDCKIGHKRLGFSHEIDISHNDIQNKA